MTALDQHVAQRIAVAETGCWEWTGARDSDGYGRLYTREKLVRAHRLVYEALVGPIPDGLQIDHLCRNKVCVNPEHLEPVTHAENQRRNRGLLPLRRKPYCGRGHPMSGPNLGIDHRGKRYCKACKTIHKRDYRARKRA